jgi:hypothetical protein
LPHISPRFAAWLTHSFIVAVSAAGEAELELEEDKADEDEGLLVVDLGAF